jgi:hypothetical protein
LRSNEQAFISDGFQRWEFFLVFFELAALLLTTFVVLRNPSVSGGHVRSSCLTLLGVITAISMTEVNAKNAELCVRAAPAAFARVGASMLIAFLRRRLNPPLPPPRLRSDTLRTYYNSGARYYGYRVTMKQVHSVRAYYAGLLIWCVARRASACARRC